MAKNLLIDTCVLKELVSKTDYSNYLKQIALWAEHDYVTIYVPNVLMEEWDKHKTIEEERIEKALKQYEGDKRKVSLFGLEEQIDIGEPELEFADKKLKSQIARIDELLRQGVQIDQGDAEIVQMWAHKKAGKAPFINKKDSENDALLIFSALEELNRRGEKELYFFSSNKNEFGSPLSIETLLHPDIVNFKPDITVQYFAKFTHGIEALLAKGLPSTRVKANQLNNIKNVISIDRKIPVANQLRIYLERRFEDINFLPEQLFSRHYPFINTERFTFYPKPFTVLTNNPEVVKLFENISDSTGIYLNEASVSADIVWISKVLRHNLIHHIEVGDRKTYEIPWNGIEVQCDCPRCLFQQFLFPEFLRGFPETKVDFDVTLAQAYYLYMGGKFRSAVSVLQKVGEKALSDGKKLTYFISRFNMTKLRRLIEYNAYKDTEYEQLKEELKTIDLENDALLAEDKTNIDILKWIKETSFEETALEALTKQVHSIREDFYNGNSGFNNHTRVLLAKYFEAESFLQLNFIIYDEFNEFTELTNVFTEGLFASHACKDTLSGKLLFFTDPILERIVWHSRHEHIKKMFYRYNLKSLKYVPSSNENGFLNMFCNYLNGHQHTVNAFAQYDSEGIDIFWNKYRRYFHNGMAICAVLELDYDQVTQLTNSLLNFLKIEQHLLEHELTKSLRFYLFQKKDYLTDDQLRGFIWYALTSDQTSREDLADLLTTLARERNFKLCLEPSEWEYLQNHYLINSFPTPESDGMLLICYLFEFLGDSTKKKEVSTFIRHYLKANYHYRIYYLAVMFDIIPFQKSYSARYASDMLAIINKGRNPRPFERKNYYNDGRIDSYINYCFKYQLPLGDAFRKLVIKLDIYYDWLTDMENFDYSQFQSDWLFNYFTKFKKDQYRQSNQLKSHLLKLCSKSENAALLRLFIEVYTDIADKEYFN
jgi:hypothetical protein